MIVLEIPVSAKNCKYIHDRSSFTELINVFFGKELVGNFTACNTKRRSVNDDFIVIDISSLEIQKHIVNKARKLG